MPTLFCFRMDRKETKRQSTQNNDKRQCVRCLLWSFVTHVFDTLMVRIYTTDLTLVDGGVEGGWSVCFVLFLRGHGDISSSGVPK